MQMLQEAKFVATTNPEAPELNINSENIKLVKAVITAGLYPNVARILKRQGGKNKGAFKSLALSGTQRASFHLKSVNEQERWFEHSWVVYWQKVKTNHVSAN